MRNISRLKIIIMTLGIVFTFLCISNYNIFNEQDGTIEIREESNLKSPRKSGYWNLTGSPIFIDDDDPTNNWGITAATNDWCSGSGSLNDPYIIENVTIDGQGSGRCIYIRDSIKYFIIRNCTVYNAIDGIRLEKTSNGTISENIVDHNGNYGIRLYNDCDNNSILKNSVSQADYYGIYLDYDCDNNRILENSAHTSSCGISLSNYCDGNIISGNNFYNNEDYAGIRLVLDCYNNTVSGNSLCNNDYGLYIAGYNVYNTIITGNIISDNHVVGLYISAYSNLLYANCFIENKYHALQYGNNQWDNGYVGNYWDNYSGVDFLPEDGIGDFPFSLPTLTIIYDTKPLMYLISEDTDGDGLHNLEEYTLGDDGYHTNPVDPDTDDDSFSDGDEADYNTNPLDPLWYPMPNLKVSHLSSVVAYISTSFVLDFSISNNGIWKAEGVIVIIKCEELDFTLFNNTDSPFNIEVDDTEYISIACLPFEITGEFTLSLIVDPDNLINEIYSLKNGSLRTDWELDNSMQAFLSIVSMKSNGGKGMDFVLIFSLGSIVGVATGVLITFGIIRLRKRHKLV